MGGFCSVDEWHSYPSTLMTWVYMKVSLCMSANGQVKGFPCLSLLWLTPGSRENYTRAVVPAKCLAFSGVACIPVVKKYLYQCRTDRYTKLHSLDVGGFGTG